MIAMIDDKREEIAALCRQYGIRKLELFGSAATGTFDPATSDLDFIVDLGEYEEGVSHRFLGFADALEALFGRRVDVITEPSIRNPYFRAEVNETRRPVYAATDREAAVVPTAGIELLQRKHLRDGMGTITGARASISSRFAPINGDACLGTSMAMS